MTIMTKMKKQKLQQVTYQNGNTLTKVKEIEGL